MENEFEFGTFVRYMRQSAGLSAKQLALKMGCSKSTVCNYENGYKIPQDTSDFECRLRITVKEEIRKKREMAHEDVS